MLFCCAVVTTLDDTPVMKTGVFVSALRDKLEDRDRRLIRTVRGVGYALSG